MMTDLKLAQQSLISALDVGNTGDDVNELFSVISGSSGFPAEQRLKIYRSNYTGALLNALQSIYPVCQMILGEQCFRGLAKEFIWSSPSCADDLNVYGEHWPEKLASLLQTTPAFADYVYLPDLALLEWYWHAAYYRADDPCFDFQGFAKFCAEAPEQEIESIHFEISHSLKHLTTPYPVFEIWSQHKVDGRCEQVEAISEPQSLVIYRSDSAVQVVPVEQSICQFLDACRRGNTMAELSALAEESGKPLNSVLPELIRKRFITKWYCSADTATGEVPRNQSGVPKFV